MGRVIPAAVVVIAVVVIAVVVIAVVVVGAGWTHWRGRSSPETPNGTAGYE